MANPSNDTTNQWHAWYTAWIRRFWPRIHQEATAHHIMPAQARGMPTARTLASTAVSDPVVALCHYLVEAYQHIDTHYNRGIAAIHGHPVAEWAYPELTIADHGAAEAGRETVVVLRFWLRDPGVGVRKGRAGGKMLWDYGCVVLPVPGYWRELGGVRVGGLLRREGEGKKAEQVERIEKPLGGNEEKDEKRIQDLAKAETGVQHRLDNQRAEAHQSVCGAHRRSTRLEQRREQGHQH